jgi:hypothetical protein
VTPWKTWPIHEQTDPFSVTRCTNPLDCVQTVVGRSRLGARFASAPARRAPDGVFTVRTARTHNAYSQHAAIRRHTTGSPEGSQDGDVQNNVWPRGDMLKEAP